MSSLQFSAITLSLPLNVHLLTFEPWRRDNVDGNRYLLRFEHLLEKDEDPEYSKPVKFNFEDVFRNLEIWSVRETTLAGNQWIGDAKRFKFVADPPTLKYDTVNHKFDYSIPEELLDKENEVDSNKEEPRRYYGIDYEVTLAPMQIRTFIIQLAPQF